MLMYAPCKIKIVLIDNDISNLTSIFALLYYFTYLQPKLPSVLQML